MWLLVDSGTAASTDMVRIPFSSGVRPGNSGLVHKHLGHWYIMPTRTEPEAWVRR